MHVGAELEFFLMHADGSTIDETGYCCAENDPTFLAQKEELFKLLDNHNIFVEKMHHEVAPGQHEIVLHHDTPTNVADEIIMTRHLISQWAHQHDFAVDFRPKPLAGENGSALHVHFSCFDLETNTNLFFDEQETAHLSSFSQNALAEVLHNVTDITALLNPTANSYERLQPGFEAPVAICWAMQNRSALIRIPAISHPNECRAEIRSPDSIANPYLIFAALLESTLASISHGKALRPAVHENVYQLTKEELDAYHITFLPASLEDALAKLENSDNTHNLFNTYFIEQFCKEKRKELQTQ
jgi:glutamine synthetase